MAHPQPSCAMCSHLLSSGCVFILPSVHAAPCCALLMQGSATTLVQQAYTNTSYTPRLEWLFSHSSPT
eukprot:scaffold289508_cov42-Tisochrysis_lutea.AAC.1